MFQTKVKQEYIQQMYSKDFYQYWLEQALWDFSTCNYEFEAVKYTGYLFKINEAVARAFSVLRHDLLEPYQYEKLWTAATDFANKIFDFYYSCTYPGSPINNYIHPVKLYNILNLVSQVVPRMYFLTIVGKIVQMRINQQLADLDDAQKAPALTKNGVTRESLAKQSSDLIFDLVEGARGIQHPTKLIFFRKFLIATLRPVLPARQFQQFQLDNLIEMNRFWCRTAFDPARTKAEERRRDERRKHLGDIIYTGFIELAKASVATVHGAAIFEKVLEQLQVCGDQMATSHLMNAIAGEMDAVQLLKNLGNILKTVCTQVSGVGTFVKILEKLSTCSYLTETHFDALCSSGMDLAYKIVDIYFQQGQEELLRQIAIGGELVSSITSPWIAILSFLMKIGSKLWPEDLSKISFAFDLIIQVLFPDMYDNINAVALELNPDAICFVEDEQDVYKAVPCKLSDYYQRTMIDVDSESIADLMIAPLFDLDVSLVVPFIMLAPMIILRVCIAPEQRRRFYLTLVRAIIQRPLIDEDFEENREAHEQQGRNVIVAVQDLLRGDSVEFAKVLHCVHGSAYLFYQIREGSLYLDYQASQNVIAALFFTLLRDNSVESALVCLDYMDDVSGMQSVCLHLEAARIALRRGQDGYKHLQRVFEVYELCAISTYQRVLLGIIINTLLELDIGGETETMLSRCKAAAYHFLQRESRCVSMAQVRYLYAAKNLDTAVADRLVDELGLKFGTNATRALCNVILGREAVEAPVFAKVYPNVVQTAVEEEVIEEEVVEEEIEIIEEVIEEREEEAFDY